MASRYQRKRQSFRITSDGSVAAGVLGFYLLFEHATVGPILVMLTTTVIAGLIIGLIAVALDESKLGAILPFLYGAGAATIGLIPFTHDGVFLVTVAFAIFGAVLVTGSAMYRFQANWIAPLGLLIGTGVASISLYLL